MLCTDGLSGLVSEEELRRIVEQFVPQESVYHLVERANENGGPDNITAIVVHVQEVGVEPPGVRHPVRVGGREMGEDTALLGMLPTASLGPFTSNGEGRIPSAPLRLSSGPLTSSPESITAPQPALGKSQRSRSRLFYPTLLLLILLVITIVGGGAFYFLRANESQTVTQALNNAQLRIKDALTVIYSDPTLALNKLASAQNTLNNVQKNHQLDDTQEQRYKDLQGDLVAKVKAAIGSYNQHAHIFVLPCTNSSTTPIDTTSTHTYPQSIAWAQDAKGAPLLYTLAQDNGLYQLNSQYSLVSRVSSDANTRVLSISSNGSRLFGLVEQFKESTPAGYTFNVYQPDQTGALGTPISSAQIGADFTKDGYAPALTTAWANNVYIVLSSPSNPNNAHVLNYTLDGNGHLGKTPKSLIFSISAPIVSVTAFPQQLFLLLSDGEVRSLSLLNEGQPPLPVLVQTPVDPPLATSAQDFAASMSVPTVTPDQQGVRTSLSVPSSSPTSTAMLATGGVNGTPHLYIGDPAKHRVLDLQVAESTAGGPATPTPTGTGTAGNSITLQLVQQVVSPEYLSMVKSLAVDPKGDKLDILSQNSPSMVSLISVMTGLQTEC